MRGWRGLPLLALSCASCSGTHSVLNPAGRQAARIGSLWWLMLAVETGVFVVVLALLAYGVWHRRGAATTDPRPPGREPRLVFAVGAGVGLTVLILFTFLVASVLTGRAVASLGTPHPVSIEVIGHQWWWELRYEDPIASNIFTTANEMHIPVGEAVVLKLISRDVIHSFWVPALHGKQDLIPGYETAFWIQAEYPGVYRGQCAEFCGDQHAHMAIEVVAEPKAKFEAWLRQQRQAAVPPSTDTERRGQQVFLSAPCTQCHSIRGTTAGASVAPDLTHLASRTTLAAGTIPNTTGHLAGWVLDPQRIKPGNLMPPNAIGSADLQALVAYLRSLK